MNLKKTPLICFIILLIFLSCSKSDQGWMLLKEAERLSSQYPSEALVLLQKVEQYATSNDSCKALYAFVLNKTLVYSSTPVSSDSSIQFAINYYTKVGDSTRLQESLYLKGIIKYRKMEYGASINTLQAANRIALQKKSAYSVITNYQFIGYNWNMLNKNTEAIANLRLAVEVARTLKDTTTLLSTLINLANLQADNQDYKGALTNLNEAEANARIVKNKEFLNSIFAKQSTIYEQSGDLAKALASNDSVRAYRNDREEIPSVNLTRAILFSKQKNADSTFKYAQIAINSNDNFVADVAYSLLYDMERHRGHLMEALAYKQKFDHMFESLNSGIQSAAMAQKYQKEKLENENNLLKIKKKERDIWLLSIIMGIILLAALAYIAFLRFKRIQAEQKQKMQEELLKNKSEKLESENLLLKQQQEISQLREKEALMRESIFRRISFFKKIPSLTHLEEQEELLEPKTSKKILLTDNDWKELIQNIDEVYPHFTSRLSASFNELDKDDILFCCLVKINVNLQDLSDIYCLSKAAITKKKYRLKKDKMHVTDKDLSLDDYLSTF